VVRHWHRLPREAVAGPSPGRVQGQVGQGWSTLVQWKVSLPMAGRLEQDGLQGPF